MLIHTDILYRDLSSKPLRFCQNRFFEALRAIALVFGLKWFALAANKPAGSWRSAKSRLLRSEAAASMGRRACFTIEMVLNGGSIINRLTSCHPEEAISLGPWANPGIVS